MATLEGDGWALDNAEVQHAASPQTFHIPSRAEREALRPGQMVKLLFLFLNRDRDGSPIIDCERMWVTLKSVTPTGFEGQLESMPATSKALAPLATIRFGPEHVAGVFVRKSDPQHPSYGAGNEAEA
jgi:hypothetical protein